MHLTRRAMIGGTASLAFTGLPLRASAQEVTINAVHFTPAQVSYAKSFLKFVDTVNQRGKGIIQIKVRGGPEIMPLARSSHGFLVVAAKTSPSGTRLR